MSLLTNRIIFENDTTLEDLSVNLNNPVSGSETVDLVSADDYIYVGSELPFNQRYFRISTVNALASVLSVQLWDGSTWNEAVDVIDETALSGASLGQSGIVSWKLDKEKNWVYKDTDDMTGSGLETLKIYGLYWARFTFSADITPTTAIDYVGYKFNTDNDLASQFPELNTSSVKTQFESGKTDWETQELEAALYIVRDLKQRKEIVSVNQILDAAQLRHPSVFKVAEIIYRQFGDDYTDQMTEAKEMYKQTLNTLFRIDKNGDTQLDGSEMISNINLERR